jgi:hypothetical protein
MAIQQQTIHSILANLSCNVSSFPWAMTYRVVPSHYTEQKN